MKTNFRGAVMFAVLVSVQTGFAAEDALPKLAAANNTFAFKLLKELATQNQSANLFVSPYSAATALQMAANGAAGQTKTEMQQVLETTALTPAELNAACKAAADSLNSNNRDVVLTTANALWYRQGSAVKPDFLKVNRNYFSSTIRALDFANVPAAEAEINTWASDQTHERITGIADGMIDPVYADLILVNAIYFKGKWLDQFDAKLTKERPFHPLSGATKILPMMENSAIFAFRHGSGYEAVRLPYRGNNLAMYVFLPAPGSTPAKLLQTLNGDNWRRETVRKFTEEEVRLVLPKFKLETMIDLNPALKTLGMKTAFSNQKSKSDADFSKMFSDPHHISEVRQKAFVEVNEEGTEAAAASAVGLNTLGIPFRMIVDRPFLFVIVDARSEMILFLGVVNNL